jgi:sugar lactone lactonase YvrE
MHKMCRTLSCVISPSLLLLAIPAFFAPSVAQSQTALGGVITSLGGGFSNPSGMTTDSSGNVYVADTGNNAVKEIPAGCTAANYGSNSCTVTVLGNGFNFSSPHGVALDSSGNIYVADTGNNAVEMLTPGCTSASCVTTLPIAFTGPKAVVVDVNGNMAVLDSSSTPVKGIPTGCGSSSCVKTLGGGFSSPSALALAIDYIGEELLYVADSGNNAVKYLFLDCATSHEKFDDSCGSVTTLNNSCTYAGCVSAAGGGFSDPQGLVGENGIIYIADSGNNLIKKVPVIFATFTTIGECTSPSCVDIVGAGSNLAGVAADGNGNVYASTSGTATVEEISQNTGFSSVQLGTASSQQTITFPTTSSVTLGAPVALTQGATGQNSDYSIASGGTCTSGASFTAGQSCTVNVTFTPRFPGARYGAVQLVNSSNAVIGTANVNGTGMGAEPIFSPAAQTTLMNNTNATAVTVDGNGNIYIINSQTTVVEIPPGCTTTACEITVGGGFSDPNALATDGAGNVYVSDAENSAVKLIPPGCRSASCVSVVASGFYPEGLAVDDSGNIYTDSQYFASETSLAYAVYELPAGCNTLACAISLGGGFSQPGALALDASNDVYVADYYNHAIKEIPVGCTSASCVNTLANPQYPTGLAVDAAGNVYVSQYYQPLLVIPAGCTANCTTTNISGGLYNPGGIAIDPSGNLYFSNDPDFYELAQGTAPTWSFAYSAPDYPSPSNPQSIAVGNIGNEPLTFPALSTGNPAFSPTTSSGFQLDGSTTCPVLTPASSAASLAVDESCLLAVDFTPPSDGTFTGSLVITDNGPGAILPAYATQGIGLSGIGFAPLTGTTVSTSSSSIFIGQSVTFTATVTNLTNSGPSGYYFQSPTGTVTFLVDGVPQSPVTLAPWEGYSFTGIATATFTISTLPVGTHTIQANYTGNTNYAASSASLAGNLTVSPNSTSTAVTSSLNPSTLAQSVTFTASVNDTSSGTAPTGTVTFIINGTPGNPVAVNPGSGSSSTATFTTSTLSPGTYTIQAIYSGSTDFNSSTGSLSGGQLVNGISTSTTVSSSLNPITFGQSASFAVTVTNTASGTPDGAPAGTVTFSVDGANQAPITLVAASSISSTASLTVPLLSAGTHNIQASYSGGSNFSPSSGSLGEVVNQVIPTVSIWPTASAIILGQSLYQSTLTPSSSTGSDGYASVPGTFNWAYQYSQPGGGTSSQVVVFTPNDSNDYAQVYGNVNITVTLPNFVVNTTADDNGYYICTVLTSTISNTTDGNNGGNPGLCTLRDAVNMVGYYNGAGNIYFDTTIFAASNLVGNPQANTIMLDTADNGSIYLQPYDGNLNILGLTAGSGATLTNLVTVNGGWTGNSSTANGGDQTIFVGEDYYGYPAVINNLNIVDGYAGGGSGGAITNFYGPISLSGVNIINNVATGSGGGILNLAGAVNVVNSTFSGNSATGGNGGAIYNANWYGCGAVTVSNSTFSNNSAVNGGYGGGGALANDPYGCSMTIVNSTIYGNTADANGNGGGINIGTYSSLALSNSIVSGNMDLSGYVDDLDDSGNGGNYVSNTGSIINGNLVGYYNGAAENGTSVALAPLGSHGGPTQTIVPEPGSVAICGGLAADIVPGVTTDQRGYSNVNTTYPGYSSSTPCVDSGAVQTNYAISFTKQPPASAASGRALDPAPVVSLFESGVPFTAGTGTVTMTDSASLLTGTTSEPLASGVATFKDVIISTHTTGDILTAMLTLDSPLSLSVNARGVTATGLSAQTISFTQPTSPVTFTPGFQITLNATGGGSGNPVVFSIGSTSTGAGIITGNVLTVTGAGTLMIDANQAGNSNYIAATQVAKELRVLPAAQAISFTQPTTPVTYVPGLQIALTATGGASGNPVVFSIESSGTGVGTITGNVLTVTSAGTFAIEANQAGSAGYSAAPQVVRRIDVRTASQTISFTQPKSPVTYSPDLQITLTATGGASGNPVVFSIGSTSTGAGTIANNVLTVTGPGLFHIYATQAGNADYSAAPQVVKTVDVLP